MHFFQIKMNGTSSCEPMVDNTSHQLPPRQYILVSVSVDTVPIKGLPTVWQISVNIPTLVNNGDPDYECLILPTVLKDETDSSIWAEFQFTHNPECELIYHHSTEFGRRKVETEENGIDNLVNYLEEIRCGLHGSSANNGLILLFESSEDFALLNQLISKHCHHIFPDPIKAVVCLDNFLRLTQANLSNTYGNPIYIFRPSNGNEKHWSARVIIDGDTARQINAISKPEIIYKICKDRLGATPDFDNFFKNYCYPVNHIKINEMLSTSTHILELLPLYDYVAQHLFEKKQQLALQGIFYTANAHTISQSPNKHCARQTIRQLLSFGYTLASMEKLFRTNPYYDLPIAIFLQNTTTVQSLIIWLQSNVIRNLIKQYFIRQRK